MEMLYDLRFGLQGRSCHRQRRKAKYREVRDELQKITGSRVMINVQEIKDPDKNAQIVAEGIASALERRVSFRRAMKQAIFRAMKAGALGVKTQCSGRLGGAEIARRGVSGGPITYQPEGRYRLRIAEARTMYGIIGVKVWIYNGDVLPSLEERPRDEVCEREGGEVVMLMPKESNTENLFVGLCEQDEGWRNGRLRRLWIAASKTSG